MPELALRPVLASVLSDVVRDRLGSCGDSEVGRADMGSICAA